MFEFATEDSVSAGDRTPPAGARMTVLGAGGAGGNAVSRMIDDGLPGVRFVVINTDAQALGNLREKHRGQGLSLIQIGADLTKGLGSGGRPDIGREATKENLSEVIDAIRDTDLLFLAAGMGGGTGTGAIPVIAECARELGILTVAIVSTPFHFEARRRMGYAEEGLERLTRHADIVITIPNEKLMQIVPRGTSFDEALKIADSVLMGATRGISGILFRAGTINTDFADFRTIMANGGKAIMGSGVGKGDDAAKEAATQAVNSPFLENTDLSGATRLLINVRGGSRADALLISQAVTQVQQSAHPDAEVIFGLDVDPQMGDDVSVTVIATGFDPHDTGDDYGDEGIRHEASIAEVTPAEVSVDRDARGKTLLGFTRDIFSRGGNRPRLSGMPGGPQVPPSYLREDF